MTKFNSSIAPFLLIGVFSLVFSGCSGSGDDYAQNAIEIPIKSDYPYSESSIDQVVSNESFGLNTEGSIFSQILNGTNKLSGVNTGFLTSGESVAQYLFEDNLIILDTEYNELISYSISQNEITKIASFGRGPGELTQSVDLNVLNGRVYVGRGDRKISVFNCSNQKAVSSDSVCQYSKTIDLPVTPVDVAVISENEFAILGFYNTDTPEGFVLEEGLRVNNSIFVVDSTGVVQRQFGDLYDTHGHWMLQSSMSTGKIELLGMDTIVLYYDRLPYLYYLATDGELISKHEFSNFNLGTQRYSPATGYRENVFQDYSLITAVSKKGTHQVIFEITHYDNLTDQLGSVDWAFERDYYLYDITTTSYTFVGSTSELESTTGKYLPINDDVISIIDGSMFFNGF